MTDESIGTENETVTAAAPNGSRSVVITRERHDLPGMRSVVSVSRNLRQVLSYARRHNTTVIKVYSRPIEDGKGRLTVIWRDTAVCVTDFASYQVLCTWIRARRSWSDAIWEDEHDHTPAQLPLYLVR